MKPSLQFVAGYVPDAFAQPKTFVPENVTFGVYTFVPWVRSGLSAALDPPSPGSLRATVQASVTVRGDNNEQETATKTLTLRGPGDVISLDAAQIIRRVPQRDTLDAEENFLVHVEFDRPELPWLFSPFAAAGERLQPWIALVVCDATVSEVFPGPPGLPQQLRTKGRELQPLDDSWAWAHAQILGGATGEPPVRERLSASHGPTNLSRLLCPRRLEAGHRYIAAVVPAFDCGVRAAMNLSGGALTPAWDASNPDGEITLPVFDWWRFSTGPGGDFEQLAGRLHGVAAPWSVGRRFVDTTKAAPPGLQLPAGAPGAIQVLKCALISPSPAPAGAVAEDAGWETLTREKLRMEVDRANASNEDLPRVGARLYGRFQRGAYALGPVFGTPPLDTTAADADWFPQLNTSPIHRIVAGLGTRVVQRDQEPLMQAAWTQAAGIRKANHALVQMQFGRYVGEALHRNHFSKLSLGSLVQAVRGVQSKIRFPGSELTVEGAVSRSIVAPAATSAAFRRVARVRGPVARFASAASLRSLVATNDRFRDFRRTYQEPEGIAKLSSGAIESFSDDVIGRVLGVDPSAARPALAARLNAWTGPVLTDRLTRPLTTWRIPAGSLDLGERAARLVDERVRSALPRTTGSDTARAEALAPLLVALRNTGVETVARRADRIVNRIDRQLPFSAPRRVAGLPTHLGRAMTAQDVTEGPRSARPERLASLPLERPIARLRFENEATRRFTGTVSRLRQVAIADVATALSDAVLGIGVAQLPRTPERPALALTRKDLLDAIAPATTVTAYARVRFDKLKSLIAGDWWDDGRVSPIMTAPRFDRAMFEALADYDRDWIVPGLGEIAFTDFVTVLSTNPIFTETFLIGLSDEMGRELLWRGYPTDQRGTYFYRFWSRDADDLGTAIHRFRTTPLGTHLAAGASAEGCVVLVIRGELVRRYPEAVVLAMRAGGTDKEGRPQFTANASDVATILFHHHLQPDIRLVGFKLRPSQIQTEPWWFLITENPSGPRFGLDLAAPAAPSGDYVARNDLDWNDLGPLTSGRFLSALARSLIVTDDASEPKTTTWPGNSAIVARTLLQNPVRAAFDAKKLIAPALV